MKPETREEISPYDRERLGVILRRGGRFSFLSFTRTHQILFLSLHQTILANVSFYCGEEITHSVRQRATISRAPGFSSQCSSEHAPACLVEEDVRVVAH